MTLASILTTERVELLFQLVRWLGVLAFVRLGAFAWTWWKKKADHMRRS